MSDLRTLLRRYERAQEEAGDKLERAIRARIAQGGRGEQQRVADELGWSRQRLSDWLKVRARRDRSLALTRSEAAEPAREPSIPGTSNARTETERERADG